METDDTINSESEPWLTARDIIADQGFNAEFFVMRLAAELADEGNNEDASKLGEVLSAITVIRRQSGISAPLGLH